MHTFAGARGDAQTLICECVDAAINTHTQHQGCARSRWKMQIRRLWNCARRVWLFRPRTNESYSATSCAPEKSQQKGRQPTRKTVTGQLPTPLCNRTIKINKAIKISTWWSSKKVFTFPAGISIVDHEKGDWKGTVCAALNLWVAKGQFLA